ncbi:MAG: DNA/RNA nuclease SfsA [Spirochaetota bacterium]
MEAPTDKNDNSGPVGPAEINLAQSEAAMPDKGAKNLTLFRADARARFVRRPNRFLIIAELEEILHNDASGLQTTGDNTASLQTVGDNDVPISQAAGEHAATGLQPAGDNAAAISQPSGEHDASLQTVGDNDVPISQAAGEHAATGLQPAGDNAAGPAWSPGSRGPQPGDEVACHCPNPGRLLEFVIPGTELLLERRRGWSGGDSHASSGQADGAGGRGSGQVDNADDLERGDQAGGGQGSGKADIGGGRASSGQGSGRAGPKTQWTAVAVRYEGRMVPLFSARANGVVEQGVLPELFPQARNIQAEYTLADSRFDFMVQDGDGNTHLIEVKACSLVEEGIAMFPDAPSERAVKHIEELAELASRGYRCHILFVIVHGNPERFIPNLHTDPAFAAALSKAAANIQVHAVTLEANENGEGHIINMNVPVDLSYGGLAEENRGSYLLVLELPDSVQVDVGSLGPVAFKAGWYVYSGSAQKNLTQRIGRHLRHVRKQPHWHLDYLTPHAGKIVGLPIASYENLECELAAELEKIGGTGVPRFGSTDCSCGSHLFYFSSPPLKNRAFLKVLFTFRHRRALNLPYWN